MDKDIKQEIINKYATHEGDTGSPEVQIALLTYRIDHLNEHLKSHKKITTQDVACLKWSVLDVAS